MAKLKPCPFCGAEAFLDKYVYDLEPGCASTHFVECNGCHATTFEYDSKEEATEAWNRRANDSNNL